MMAENLEWVASALRMATPLALCGLGAVWSERCGVINIGLEGMMMAGAFWGAVGAFWGGPIWGLALAAAAGLALALLHAIMTVTARIDQIVCGIAINILAYGLNRFFSYHIFEMAANSPNVKGLPRIMIAGTELSWLVPVTLLLTFCTSLLFYRTGFGLRLQAVGENPAAADAVGISVVLTRYVGVLLGGLLAGMAGGYLAIEHTGMYVEGMTQGRGFIALAAMIIGNWQPWKTVGAAMMFGLFDALSFRLVSHPSIPYQWIQMIPYLLTLAILSGLRGKIKPPAAAGRPWSREEAMK